MNLAYYYVGMGWYLTPISRCLFICSLGPARALAIYPLQYRIKGKDVGLFGNPPGILGFVRPAVGPDGKPGTSYQFYGRRNSLIRFPNRGRLDAQKAITLLAWLYPEGPGPIFKYGVDFSVGRARSLFIRIFPRGSRNSRIRPLRARGVLRYRRWHFVAASYEQKTGETRIYVNGRLVSRTRLRRVRLGTNIPAIMGAARSRYFRGRISCMQIYGRVLSRWQIIKRKTKCFKGKRHFVTVCCFTLVKHALRGGIYEQ